MILFILVSWTVIVLALVKVLGPILAKFIGAQIAAFAEKNPKWAAGATRGLEIAKDIALAVVEDTSHAKAPEHATDDERNAFLRELAVREMAARLAVRGITYGENDMRRDL
jgi:hypothetical protein